MIKNTEPEEKWLHIQVTKHNIQRRLQTVIDQSCLIAIKILEQAF